MPQELPGPRLTSGSACALGYEGPLCGVCSAGCAAAPRPPGCTSSAPHAAAAPRRPGPRVTSQARRRRGGALLTRPAPRRRRFAFDGPNCVPCSPASAFDNWRQWQVALLILAILLAALAIVFGVFLSVLFPEVVVRAPGVAQPPRRDGSGKTRRGGVPTSETQCGGRLAGLLAPRREAGRPGWLRVRRPLTTHSSFLPLSSSAAAQAALKARLPLRRLLARAPGGGTTEAATDEALVVVEVDGSGNNSDARKPVRAEPTGGSGASAVRPSSGGGRRGLVLPCPHRFGTFA